jgi:hypothetical protein
MKIYACPKCGSKDIHIGTLDSGVTYGVTSWDYTCRYCNYKGMPLIFDSENDYKIFLKNLLEEKKIDKKMQKEIKPKKEDYDKEIELSKSDEEIIDYIKDIIDEEKDLDKERIHWHGNRSWWLEIGIAFGISAILTAFGFPVMVYSMNYFFAVLYGLFIFFVEGLFILAIIVVIEYFILFKFLKK